MCPDVPTLVTAPILNEGVLTWTFQQSPLNLTIGADAVRHGSESIDQAASYVAEVTQERRDHSAGTHTRSLIDPFRAPARRPFRNEDTSQAEASRIDVAPHAGRCVYLPPRNDAAQSPAKSRRGSSHSHDRRRR